MAPKAATKDDRRKAGRPPAVFRGRAAALRKKKEAEAAAKATSTPEASPHPTLPQNPPKGIAPLSAFGALRARLVSLRQLATFEPVRNLRRMPDFLAPAKHDPSWTHVKDVPTHEVYQWFENEVRADAQRLTYETDVRPQKNDYLCHSFKRCRAVKLTWIGHPGDSPADIRARELMVSFDRDQGLAEADFDKAIATRRPVLRWTYHCAGVHDRVVEEDCEAEEGESDGEDEGTGGGADDVEDVDEDADGQQDDDLELRTRWKRCSDRVKLRVGGHAMCRAP